ncbi:MAG: hypothetical protein IPL28_10115 [Chloroflexi bacterium]|nr:hypothetical protein [Chloroflexota bacterium]
MFPTKHLPTIFLLTLALCLLGCNTAAPTHAAHPTPTAAQSWGKQRSCRTAAVATVQADEAIP